MAEKHDMNDESGRELPTEMQCNSCGATVAPGSFCRRCGASMSGLLAETNAAVDAGGRSKRPALIAAGALIASAGVVGAVMLLTGESDEQVRSSIEAEATMPAVSEDVTATSGVVPETTVTKPPPTTSAPEVTTTIVALPIGLADSLTKAEPFRYSFPDGSMPPDLPETLEDHVVYEGSDAAGLAGRVRTTALRVFDDTNALMPIPEFSTQMNGCGETFWILRWVSSNPDVRIVASNELDPSFSSNGVVVDEPWLLPPAAPAGIMGASICFTPGFEFESTVNGNQANLADVTVEWTYFDRDPFAASGSSDNASSTSCNGFTYDDGLPISVCSEGTSVAMFQGALGVEADGFFGAGTEAAVREFQARVGLLVTGVMDTQTWSYLGLNEGVPFPDLNGDGSIDYQECPLD